jgi:hypothetical protein
MASPLSSLIRFFTEIRNCAAVIFSKKMIAHVLLSTAKDLFSLTAASYSGQGKKFQFFSS